MGLTSERAQITWTMFHFLGLISKKSSEKFSIGLIWALYSDEDGLPKKDEVVSSPVTLLTSIFNPISFGQACTTIKLGVFYFYAGLLLALSLFEEELAE